MRTALPRSLCFSLTCSDSFLYLNLLFFLVYLSLYDYRILYSMIHGSQICLPCSLCFDGRTPREVSRFQANERPSSRVHRLKTKTGHGCRWCTRFCRTHEAQVLELCRGIRDPIHGGRRWSASATG